MTHIFKVIQQGEAFAVQKADSSQTQKCNIILQELGGKYENQYVATMLGNMATCKFFPGDIVAAKLRFNTHEHGGQHYQDILVQEIVSLKEKAF